VLAALHRATVALIGLGLALLVVAFALYPGGTWWDRTEDGASWLDTFLCDLTMNPALDGRPNPLGALAGQVGLALFALALAVTWELVRRVPGEFSPRPARAAGVLGLIGFPPLVWALVTPGDRLHAMAVGIAVCAATAALVLTLLAALRAREAGRAVLVLGGLVFACVVVSMALYWPTLVDQELAVRGLPAVQKLALVLLAAFLVVVVRASARGVRCMPTTAMLG
jgi:hypothetical protein